MVSRWAEQVVVVGSEAIRRVYIVPRELTGRIKPHGEGDGGRRGQRRGTARERVGEGRKVREYLGRHRSRRC
jgi:hypothetical protein